MTRTRLSGRLVRLSSPRSGRLRRTRARDRALSELTASRVPYLFGEQSSRTAKTLHDLCIIVPTEALNKMIPQVVFMSGANQLLAWQQTVSSAAPIPRAGGWKAINWDTVGGVIARMLRLCTKVVVVVQGTKVRGFYNPVQTKQLGIEVEHYSRGSILEFSVTCPEFDAIKGKGVLHLGTYSVDVSAIGLTYRELLLSLLCGVSLAAEDLGYRLALAQYTEVSTPLGSFARVTNQERNNEEISGGGRRGKEAK